MTNLRDMPMITIEQKNRFREAALKVEKERDEAKRMLATACEYLSRVSALVGGDEEEDPQTVVEMVEGVVIERDQLSDLLEAAGIDAKEIKAENARLRKERDALAAHVDRMTDVFRRLHLKSPSPIEVLQAYSYVMREAPAASLARRDARMKAEALEEALGEQQTVGGMEVVAANTIQKMAAHYRKQAEGEE